MLKRDWMLKYISSWFISACPRDRAPIWAFPLLGQHGAHYILVSLCYHYWCVFMLFPGNKGHFPCLMQAVNSQASVFKDVAFQFLMLIAWCKSQLFGYHQEISNYWMPSKIFKFFKKFKISFIHCNRTWLPPCVLAICQLWLCDQSFYSIANIDLHCTVSWRHAHFLQLDKPKSRPLCQDNTLSTVTFSSSLVLKFEHPQVQSSCIQISKRFRCTNHGCSNFFSVWYLSSLFWRPPDITYG